MIHTVRISELVQQFIPDYKITAHTINYRGEDCLIRFHHCTRLQLDRLVKQLSACV
ncbi:hypothetical protein D3C75_1381150 [compost metagenome]